MKHARLPTKEKNIGIRRLFLNIKMVRIRKLLIIFVIVFAIIIFSHSQEKENLKGKVVKIIGDLQEFGIVVEYRFGKTIILRSLGEGKRKFVLLYGDYKIIVLSNNEHEYKKMNQEEISKIISEARDDWVKEKEEQEKEYIKKLSDKLKKEAGDRNLVGQYVRVKYNKYGENREEIGVVILDQIRVSNFMILKSIKKKKDVEIYLGNNFEIYILDEGKEDRLVFDSKKKEESEQAQKARREESNRIEKTRREKNEKLYLQKKKNEFISNVKEYAKYDFQYRITGTCGSVDITYSNQYGGTEQNKNVRLPVFIGFNARGGHFLYISAQNNGKYGSVIVEIYKKGKLYKKSQSSGAYVIATVSGSL